MVIKSNETFDDLIDIKKSLQDIDEATIKSLGRVQIVRSQNDIGANTSVTNDKSSIHLYQDIPSYPISGDNKEDPVVICEGKGYLIWKSDSNDNLLVPIYFCKEADGTIISPNSIQQFYKNMYHGFHMYCDCDNKCGELKFYNRDGINHTTFKSYSHNNLWYHDIPHSTDKANISQLIHPKINRLHSAARHELWHQRLIHPGERCMTEIHKHVDGIDMPLKGNCFYRCAACLQGKPKKKNRGPSSSLKHARKRNKQARNIPSPPPEPINDNDDIIIKNAIPGQYFHMDFGFVRGSKYTIKQETGHTITSKDGYNSYLVIVDRATRYTWIFLTKTKEPPVNIVRKVLRKFKCKSPHRAVRVDQGKELGNSIDFSKMVNDEGFTLEVTGAESSSQNGITESPNNTFAQMMRCALYSADLGPEYWSYALRLSVYVKNRLPHKSIPTTPFQELTGTKADVSKLRIFGSRVCARIPGADKLPKLDHKNTNGIFLGYTSTDNNIYFEDDNTGRVLISTHVLFDEAHMSVPDSLTPIGAQALQRSGYSQTNDASIPKPILVKILSPRATKPTSSTPQSVGLDLYSASKTSITIPSDGGIASIPTDIAIEPPDGTYARIASRSGLAFKQNVHVIGGVIDPDYRGNISIGLCNHNEKEFTINQGDRIAQLVLEKVANPTVQIVDALTPTNRNIQGFGSTKKRSNVQFIEKQTTIVPNKANLISPDTSDDESIDNISRKSTVPCISSMYTDITAPFHLTLSDDPIDNTFNIKVNIKGNHKTLGLEIELDATMNRIKLLTCTPGTPAAKIPRWRSTLKNGYITKYNDTHIKSIAHLSELIENSRLNGDTSTTITFSTIERTAMHPQFGVPQIHHDQLNIIAAHLQEIKEDVNTQRFNNNSDVILPTVNKLTRRKLKETNEWPHWNTAEFKQLDQYEQQETFGPPCPLPKGANVLNLLWTYVYKEHETRF